MSLTVAVCITTHNRREELKRTLSELARLAPRPDEIIVVADGCSDGTVEFVREQHSKVRFIVHQHARGSIPSRNEMATATACDIFLSLDDDSYPIEGDFIGRLRELFAAHPRLAVASFPQRTDEHPETLVATSFGESHFTGSYANSGAAIRRAVFCDLGGYPSQFFHAYEEPDFALRCVCAGWQVRHETSLSVRHHFTATQRNEMRTHQRHARNELWSVFLRCPSPQLLPVALFRAWRQFGYAWKRGLTWALHEPKWWLACIGGLRECFAQRRPLPWQKYLAWMELVRTPIATEAEWLRKFGEERA